MRVWVYAITTEQLIQYQQLYFFKILLSGKKNPICLSHCICVLVFCYVLLKTFLYDNFTNWQVFYMLLDPLNIKSSQYPFNIDTTIFI